MEIEPADIIRLSDSKKGLIRRTKLVPLPIKEYELNRPVDPYTGKTRS